MRVRSWAARYRRDMSSSLLHAAPAVGFDQPFEMLEACHERVRRSLALLGRLIAHIDAHGHDTQSRSAARDVLRYFDLAAPHHHEDEERHVFPRLEAAGDAALVADVQRLRDDHARMAALWQVLRADLLRWSTDEAAGPIDAAARAAAEAFRAAYDGHIELEEGRVFPAARARTEPSAATAMGAEMAARRRQG
ncbi:MAG: hemerythrin domain-containing protein [Piscinibacter sp.]|nr:hemerythrin domain-containing protein [Piscinibacter sp.]